MARAAGVVSSVSLDHATPAAFYAHVPLRSEMYEIAVQLTKTNFDYFAGGGFAQPKGKNKDQQDVLEIAKSNGYKVVNKIDEIKALDKNSGKVIAINPVLDKDAALPYAIDNKAGNLALADYVKTLLLVAGFTRKAYAAILGVILSSLFACALSMVFGRLFKIHGAVMPWAESLLYSGYQHLNLTAIFLSSIYLACSGAILDLAIDISAAMEEIVEKKPGIPKQELIKSGFSIGRAVLGTQTTTLLLAYSGGFIAMMMVFMAQGTPILNILNLKYIAAEIMHTLIGCFGLILVAPLTALISGIMLSKTKHVPISNEEIIIQPEGIP